jgi:hypothetical protein
MKTIAQQLNVTDFPFEIRDKQGREIYFESYGEFWRKSEYDFVGRKIYFENSDAYWRRSEYDSEGNRIYFENSMGVIIDNRLKKDEIIILNGIKYKRIDE